ncbi:MAG: DUF1499 domain-containing protein [Rhodoferax sp.]|nr:DUF1499 domain-containing protein [Rhodoferax sp.]
MKTLRYAAALIVVLAVLLVAAGQLGFLAGQAPPDLGVHNGRLKPPSLTPNSVSSQADLYSDNPQRVYAEVAPFKYTGDGKAAMARLAGIVGHMERTTIVKNEPGYLYAQCRTRWLRFTDDLEFYLDEPAGVIQVRSASRLGKGDMGVNRARVEALRRQFEQGAESLQKQ